MDITAELKSLKNGEILLAEGFSLFEAMSATELFDKKIDVKLGLADADTPQKLLQSNQIKSGSQLTNEELIGLFDLVIQKITCWLNGNALAQTIYTLVYQYDDSLWDNPFVRALFDTLNTVGSQIFKTIKDAPFLREEDYNPSVFSFRNKRIPTIQELLTTTLNPLDTELSGKVKKSKQLTIADALSSRIKVLKGFCLIVQCLQQPFNAESQKQITDHIEFIRKRFDAVVSTKAMGKDMSNYQSATILKHLKSMISMRKIPYIENPYEYFSIMLNQLEAVLDLSAERNYFIIQQKICALIHDYPKNILIRAYLEQNLFKYDQFLFFHQTPWINIIIGTLNKMFSQNFDQLYQNVFKEYQDCLVPVTYEYIIKQLRSKFRKSRDFHKNYSHLSILVHHSNQIDQDIFKNKNPLMIFSYEIAVQSMIQQLQYGFDLELYSDVDYASIYFYLEYLTTILDRNRSNYVSQLTNSQREQLQNQNKKKPKVSPFIDQMHSEIQYWKGLNCLFRGLSRLYYTLMENGLIKKVQDMNHRYSNRMKIFDTCYYIKAVKFEEYTQKMNSYGSFQDTLKFVSSSLSEAQQLFAQAKENKILPQQMQDQSKDLVMICVVTSVNAMKLMQNQKYQISYKKTTVPFVPQIELIALQQ
ncbi:unnamed protein product (macronuclear) [Paramecium tetraurelia]|uniref:Protein MAK10 homolog n=1 Tax=Paramecium tetraurelia TaxID=5888 RepID=A0DZ31_PARTE|nr:uncharacterized protein GSPATT00003267001 [Paramecium tetraurelia]CAK88298.1 unnamed protein product [Paramecium tetraurelia]|eukprot:XP_001455695.1 hypothetical protein (macronuclear) [Paramecium tetraurelia strain d4-2]